MDEANKKQIQDFKKLIIPLIEGKEKQAVKQDENLKVNVGFEFFKKKK